MKTRRLICLLLVSVLTLVGFVLAACPKTPVEEILPPGEETGTYYYEEDGQEHLIVLNNGNKFTFVVFGENKSGTYTLDEGTLTLTFYKEKDQEQSQVLTAAYTDNFIDLEYNDRQLRFLKKVNFTVSFDTGPAQQIDSIQVTNGKTISEPVMAEIEGYYLMGWYADKNYTTPFGFGTQKNNKGYNYLRSLCNGRPDYSRIFSYFRL